MCIFKACTIEKLGIVTPVGKCNHKILITLQDISMKGLVFGLTINFWQMRQSFIKIVLVYYMKRNEKFIQKNRVTYLLVKFGKAKITL